MTPEGGLEVRPFPWGRVARVSRADARALRRCARRLPLAALARSVEASAEWLGDPLSLEPMPLARPSIERSVDPLCAAIVELAAPEDAWIALEIEPRLAAVVIERVLGGTGDDAPPHPGALTEAERGVLAYAVARVLAAAGGALRLVDVVTTPEALRVALGEQGASAWPLRAAIGPHQGLVRAWIPDALLERPAPVPAASGALVDRLGAIAITMVIESGRAGLPAADVASLAEGDVVVLDEASARPSADGLAGEVRARVRGGAARWRCALEPVAQDAARLVVRALERRPAVARRAGIEEGATMTQDGRRAAERLLEAAGDAPVELVVELARFELPLAELAALAPGEVLATGRALGERVVLRAGERTVALGELVEIEGEIGVRVLSLGPDHS